jgi:cob(I)alamin adenosyltransferase
VADVGRVRTDGLVNVFWGDGKGKTCAAMGLAVRALGQGLRVHLVPFLKGSTTSHFGVSGELKCLQTISGFTVEPLPSSGWIEGDPSATQLADCKQALCAALAAVQGGEYDVVILDEILYAPSYGLLDISEVVSLIRDRALNTELVLTGGWEAMPDVFSEADLVTEMRKGKHPFDRGIEARKGFEY